MEKISTDDLRNVAITPQQWVNLPENVMSKYNELRYDKSVKGSIFGIAQGGDGKYFIVKRTKGNLNSYDILWREE